ncbi:MAG: DUF167 domain-containing protein [bacterium]
MKLRIWKTGDGYLEFEVRVQPRSPRDEIVGLYGEALKIRLTAPPVKGKANASCVSLLARYLGVPKSDVLISGGETSRTKRVRVRGVTEESVMRGLGLI